MILVTHNVQQTLKQKLKFKSLTYSSTCNRCQSNNCSNIYNSVNTYIFYNSLSRAGFLWCINLFHSFSFLSIKSGSLHTFLFISRIFPITLPHISVGLERKHVIFQWLVQNSIANFMHCIPFPPSGIAGHFQSSKNLLHDPMGQFCLSSLYTSGVHTSPSSQVPSINPNGHRLVQSSQPCIGRIPLL